MAEPTLQEAMRELGMRYHKGPIEIAKDLEVHKTTIYDIWNGNRPTASVDLALKIARAYGEDLSHWLRLCGYPDLADEYVLAQGELVTVRGTVPAGPAGGSAFEEEVDLPAGFMRGADLAIRIRGDSMEPDFPDGAIIAVKRTAQVADGAVCVVHFDTCEYTVKRLREYPSGGLWLTPINSAYEPFPLPEGAEIVGVPVRLVVVRDIQSK